MADIRIGKEYEQAFRSICKLVEAQCIDRKVVQYASLENNEIIEQSNNNKFIYDPLIQNVENDSDKGMLEDGASWFKSFREGVVDEGNASWLNLIEDVANNYHQKYSFVEFKRKDENFNDEIKQSHKNLIAQFSNVFINELTGLEIVEDDVVTNDDIYGVSLKIEIDGGTGEAEPLLCKVYFRHKNNTFMPIYGDDALALEDELYKVIDADIEDNVDFSHESQYDNGLIIDSVLNAIEKLIESEKFSDSVVLSNEEDINIIDRLIRKSADDITQLKCRSLNVFGLSHVSWKNISYYLKYRNRNILKFDFNANNNFSVFCVNCGDELLVDNNRFIMKDGFNNVDKLDFYEVNFGYSDNLVQYIKENSILSEHLITVRCVRNGKNCSKVHCLNSLVYFGDDKTEVKCKDCPYPEIVTVDENNQLALTKNLTLANDLMKLVSSNLTVKECIYCKRAFTMDSIKSGTCPLCHQTTVTLTDNKKEEGTKLYKQYKDMLPVTTRLAYVSKEKYCFEDDGIIIFKMDDDKYIFNKMDIKFNGLMAGPKKVKIGGR